MVVYCRWKKGYEELTEALGCNFFYSFSLYNETVVEVWKEADGCLAATTALGTGRIVLAVHVGIPYGIIDFAHESGRA